MKNILVLKIIIQYLLLLIEEKIFIINNNKYYDFLSSYSSVNQGYCHPKLVKTMQTNVIN